MKIRIKTKEQLIKLFENDNYENDDDDGFSKDEEIYWNNNMFHYCGKEIDVELELEEPRYKYCFKEGSWKFHEDWVSNLKEKLDKVLDYGN